MVNSKMQPCKRVVFVLIDGLGDVSFQRFGYKTPLEAAKVPNLDAIASAGVNGLIDPVEVGLDCRSDIAYLSIMGYATITALDRANTKGALLLVPSTFNVVDTDSRTISSTEGTIVSVGYWKS
ncbi:probable 2,3-bisphosphoglycerate-independent phosphoglycerate mutase [Tanacetum coccineum]|uniref:Probable 2,3-bisphosphoglycerate-independent phosphoglycerate mutase n=1 Tax=Tanacetum coccineum TaxID=301880 RepID=A0ABQ5FCC0_9ASTR